MNSKITHWIQIFCVIVLFSTCISAQENEGFQSYKVIQDSSINVTITSNPLAQIVGYPALPEGIILIDNSHPSGNAIITYDAPSTLAKESYVVEYRGPGAPGAWPPMFSTLTFETVASILTTENDVYNYPSGNTDILITPLANDATTASSLAIADLAHVTGGTAIINPDNSILFTPDNTSNFVGQIKYIAVDDLGTSALGSITIQSDDTNAIDSLFFTLSNERAFNVLLPSDAYTVVPGEDTQLGPCSIDGLNLNYVPGAGSAGLDETTLTDGTNTLFISFEVLDKPNNSGSVRDDYVYTPVSTSISFNAFDNDLENGSGQFMVDYSSDLVYTGNGDFTFNPIPWMQGEIEYYYTIYNGFEHQTAKIYVTVDNHVPDNIVAHSLTTLEDVPLVLNYVVPIEGYAFTILSSPSNGSLSVGSGVDTLQINCNEIIGEDLIQYTPNAGYVGGDQFDLRYIINGQNGPVVKINVEVEADGQSNLCHCVGPDCVWSGDTNADGEVYLDDVLAIGLNMGEMGSSRSDITYSHWNGQHAADWETSYGDKEINTKHADTDGDGSVTFDDVQAVIDNYEQVHAFTTDSYYGSKDYGLLLDPHQTEVDSGDVLCLDILLSDVNNPVFDLHGLSFGLNFDPEIADSASMTMEFMNDSWLTYNSPYIDLSFVPYDGRLDAVVTRSDAYPMSGHGIIGTTCFIVEEGVGGFKREAKESSNHIFSISSDRVRSMDANGNYFQLENTSVDITLLTREEGESDPTTRDDIVVFPNPTSDVINVHLNGINDIKDVYIFDINNKLILSDMDIRSDHWSRDIQSLTRGVYILKIRTSDGWTAQRFEVFNK